MIPTAARGFAKAKAKPAQAPAGCSRVWQSTR